MRGDEYHEWFSSLGLDAAASPLQRTQHVHFQRFSGSVRFDKAWPLTLALALSTRYSQAAAGMGIYGPRTVFCIALKDYPGCHEFLLMDDGKWMHVKETTEIGEPRGPVLGMGAL